MIIHTLIAASTLRHGGKKSVGRQHVDISTEMQHYTPDQLVARLQALHEAGYCVDVSVLAHRDRRKPEVRVWYPANVCPECRAFRTGSGSGVRERNPELGNSRM